MKSPIKSRLILPLKNMWRAIARKNPQLFFGQKQTEELMMQVAEECKPPNGAWRRALESHELREYAPRMAKRFRTMARHIAATQKRHPDCRWLVKIFADSERASEDEEPEELLCDESSEEEEEEMSEPDDEVGPNNGLDESEDFVYGFDWELEMAWRSRGGSQEDRDWTKAITPADDPDEYPVAFSPMRQRKECPSNRSPARNIES